MTPSPAPMSSPNPSQRLPEAGAQDPWSTAQRSRRMPGARFTEVGTKANERTQLTSLTLCLLILQERFHVKQQTSTYLIPSQPLQFKWHGEKVTLLIKHAAVDTHLSLHQNNTQ